MPIKTRPMISISTLKNEIATPALNKRYVVSGTSAIDKAMESVPRSIESISSRFQKTQLQTNPGTKRINVVPKTRRNDSPIERKKLSTSATTVRTPTVTSV